MYINDFLSELSEDEKSAFREHWHKQKKDYGTAIGLCLILGNVGAHWYYLREPKKAIWYTLFFWTLLPGFVSLIDAFFVEKKVTSLNEQLAIEIREQIKQSKAS